MESRENRYSMATEIVNVCRLAEAADDCWDILDSTTVLYLNQKNPHFLSSILL